MRMELSTVASALAIALAAGASTLAAASERAALKAGPAVKGAGSGFSVAALKTPTEGTAYADNGVMGIAVGDEVGTGIGRFWVGLVEQPGQYAERNIFFDWPGSSYLTVRSYTTQTDYISMPPAVAPVPYTVFNIDPYGSLAALGPTGFRTTYALPGGATTPDALTIQSDVVVHGSTWSNSSVEETVRVTNNGTASVRIGIRYFWDLMLYQDDGPTFQAFGPTGPLLVNETDFVAPGFESYELRDNDDDYVPRSAYLAVGGTVSGPAWITPAPTAPGLLQYVAWSHAAGQSFEYTSDPTYSIGTPPFGTGHNDAAMLYFFPNGTDGFDIAPGASVTVSASLFLREQPLAGPIPVTALGALGLAGLAVLLAAAAVIALRA